MDPAFWASVANAVNRLGTFTGTLLTNGKHTHTIRLKQKRVTAFALLTVGFQKKQEKQGEPDETDHYIMHGKRFSSVMRQ